MMVEIEDRAHAVPQDDLSVQPDISLAGRIRLAAGSPAEEGLSRQSPNFVRGCFESTCHASKHQRSSIGGS